MNRPTIEQLRTVDLFDGLDEPALQQWADSATLHDAVAGERILEYGDARDIGDLCAVGDEAAIRARFKSFADAGVTDLSVRLLPIGNGRDELIASKNRTREVIAGICADFKDTAELGNADVNAPAPR